MKHVTSNRIIGFDLLRVIMVFLLIVFHAGVSFMITPLDPQVWEFQDKSTHILFDGTLSFIHTFRHPTFFLISGLLTAQMFSRYSIREIFIKRIKRLLIPLLIVALILGPFINGSLSLINGKKDPFSWDEMLLVQGDHSIHFGTSYVWFLYYLFVFSMVHLAAKIIIGASQKVLKSHSWWPFYIVLFLILTTCLSLYSWRENTLFGQYYLLPHPGSLIGYFCFYAIGAYLAGISNAVSTLSQKKVYLSLLIIGLNTLGIYMFLGHQQIVAGNNMIDFDFGVMLLSSVATVAISLGGIGAACSLYKRSHSLILFLSKSSYFLYLVHFPVIIIFMIGVFPLELHCFIKFFLILIPTLATSLCLNYIWIKIWNNNPPI